MTRHDAERKRKILDVIAATIRARGFPPSVREIAKAVGLASTSAVHHHLQILEKEGRTGLDRVVTVPCLINLSKKAEATIQVNR